MTTPIGFVIQPGKSIPEDVTGVIDCDGDEMVLNALGHWHAPSAADVETCVRDGLCGVDPITDYAPLTVTAVREQPAEPVSGLCEVAADGFSCSVVAEEHRRIYHGGLPPIVESVPVDVLDLVRQYGDRRATEIAGALAVAAHARDEAGALFARIEAEVQRLRDERGHANRVAESALSMVEARESETETLAASFLSSTNKLTIERDEALAEVEDYKALTGRLARERDDARDEVVRLGSDNDRLQRLHDAEEKASLQVIAERDDNADWADRLSQAIAEFLRVDIGEHSSMNLPWRVALIALTDAVSPAQPDPLVLTLPQVPEGAVLVGAQSGKRYTLRNGWWTTQNGDSDYSCNLFALLSDEGSVRVELPLPREPRTWPKLDPEPEREFELPTVVLVEGIEGTWKRVGDGDCFVRPDFASRTLLGLRTLGEVREVFDEDGADR